MIHIPRAWRCCRWIIYSSRYSANSRHHPSIDRFFSPSSKYTIIDDDHDDYDDSGYSVEDEDDDGDVISGASGQL